MQVAFGARVGELDLLGGERGGESGCPAAQRGERGGKKLRHTSSRLMVADGVEYGT